MAFQVLSGVDIGQGWGKSFGGFIYAADCQIGFSRGPTQITLNIVSEDGKYQAITPNVYSSPYNINFNGHVFSGMYLYAYEKNKSVQSTMTARFIDSSLVLDKIFIGLLNRQGNENVDTHMITGQFTVRCPQESMGYATGVAGQILRAVDYITTNNGCYYKKGADGGGYIILGSEYFPDSNCQIPKVDYNFTELCNAMTTFGIKHELGGFDLNSMYRQEYVGTLREVLNNWGADFAFEFFVENGVLKGIDLQEPIDLTSVSSFANTNEYVNSVSEGESLENSYNQTVIARYLKAHELVTWNNTYNYKVPAYPIRLSNILAGSTCAGRSSSCLYNSIALSKVGDGSLREAYLANYAAENNDLSVLQSLGFLQISGTPAEVTDEYSKEILIKYLGLWDNEYNRELSVYSGTRQLHRDNSDLLQVNNYKVYVGVYSENVKSRVENWDRLAADFMGKYYYYNGTIPYDTEYCPLLLGIPGTSTSGNFTTGPTTLRPAIWRPANSTGGNPWPNEFPYGSISGMILYDYNTWSYKWSSNPESRTYGGDAVPFANLLINPVSNTALSSVMSYNILEVNDNSWGTEQAQYESDKGSSDYTIWKPHVVLADEFPIPGYIPVKIMTTTLPVGTLSTTITDLFSSSISSLGGQIAYLVFPLFSRCPTIAPSVSNVFGGAINRYAYARAASSSNINQQGCKTYCEDDSVVSEICGLVWKSFPFTPYFQNLISDYSVVHHPNGNITNLVHPVQSTYFGCWTLNLTQKITVPPQKLIYGEPPITPNNTMQTRIVDYDITSEMSAMRDNNDDINSYVYSPTTSQVMTAREYYNHLASLNNMVIPPQKTIRMTIANTNFNSLGIPLSPTNGLINMNLSLSDGGMQATLEYATRPKTVPRKDAAFPMVKYRIISTANK